MKTRAFLRLAAFLFLLTPFAAKADYIASMTDPNRDYVLEGDVVTVWTDSFLFNDGSGQIIVDVRPYKIHDLGIAGRDYVQVVGRVDGNGVMRPLVLSSATHGTTMFSGDDMLEPLPFNEVMKNTIRYRLPLQRSDSAPAAQDSSAPADAGNGPARNQIAQAMHGNSDSAPAADPYASSGAFAVAAVKPVGQDDGAPATPNASQANSAVSDAVKAAQAQYSRTVRTPTITTTTTR